MRILHTIASHLWSGPSSPTAELAIEQRLQGHLVDIAWNTRRKKIIYEEPIDPPMRARGFAPPHPGLALHTKAMPWTTVADIAAFHRLRHQLDVIHCHMSHDHALASSLWYRRKRPLIVRSIHAHRSLDRRLGQKVMFRFADGFIVRSPRHRDILTNQFNIKPECIAVIPEGLRAEQWQLDDARGARREMREQLSLGDGPVAMLAAMMQPGRGHINLLTAWRDVAAHIPEARLVLAGEGNLRPTLEKQTARDQLGESVRFAGYLKKEALLSLYAAADLALLLNPGNDTGGRTVLEAMAGGRPALVVGGDDPRRFACAETIDPGVTGRVVSSDNPSDLAQALIALLNDRQELEKMGRAAQKFVITERTVPIEAEQTSRFYHQLRINRSSSSPEIAQNT